jgi:hypothetical protein
LRDPSGTIDSCRSIEASLSIPFVPTVRAAELRWWHGYLITYHSFNDFILLRDHFQDSFNYRISTVFWHTGKSARDIYATALAILQVGQSTTRLQPPNEQTSDHAKMIYLQNAVYAIEELRSVQTTGSQLAVANGTVPIYKD